jgi:hypothetical protein
MPPECQPGRRTEPGDRRVGSRGAGGGPREAEFFANTREPEWLPCARNSTPRSVQGWSKLSSASRQRTPCVPGYFGLLAALLALIAGIAKFYATSAPDLASGINVAAILTIAVWFVVAGGVIWYGPQPRSTRGSPP